MGDYYCRECGCFVARIEKGALRKGAIIICPKCEVDIYGNGSFEVHDDNKSVVDLMRMFGMGGN